MVATKLYNSAFFAILLSITVQSLVSPSRLSIGGPSKAASSEPLAKECESEAESIGSDPHESFGTCLAASHPRHDFASILQTLGVFEDSSQFGLVLHLRGPPTSH